MEENKAGTPAIRNIKVKKWRLSVSKKHALSPTFQASNQPERFELEKYLRAQEWRKCLRVRHKVPAHTDADVSLPWYMLMPQKNGIRNKK